VTSVGRNCAARGCSDLDHLRLRQIECRPTPDPPVHPRVCTRSHQIEMNNFSERVFKPLLTQAGLRRIRFHDLRHTFGSLLIQTGASLAYVREQMGHSSIQVTVDI
jgi:integrase